MIGRFNGRTVVVTVTVTFAVVAIFLQSVGAQNTNTTIDGSTSDPNAYGYGRFTPSMAILLVIFIVVVFLMGFFAIYIRHCSAAARGTVTPSGIGRRASTLRGLDPSILNTFPTFSHSEIKSHKIGKCASECAICLTEFDDAETLRVLPKCDHVFHTDCIDLWLGSHSSCPVCRADLNQLPESSTRVEVDEPLAVESSEPMLIDRIESSNRVMKAGTKIAFSKFPRSHSTGHCLVQPGENVDRFTLKLPSEIRNQIMNRGFNRSSSVVVLPSDNSLRKGFREGGPTDRETEDRWWWSELFVRNVSSVKLGLGSGGGEGTSRIMEFVRQMSVRRFGSRKYRSGSVRGDKSTRPVV